MRTLTLGAWIALGIAFAVALVAGVVSGAQATPSSDPPPRVEEECNQINGTMRPDILQGTGGCDIILGFRGPDVIFGHGGDDWLVGGRGIDRINGGPGFDTCFGGRETRREDRRNREDVMIDCERVFFQ